MSEVRWGAIPNPRAGEFTPFPDQEKEPCLSCGKVAYLRADPIVGQMVCKPCWEALMFDD